MRWNYLSLAIVALPLSNALSLANFQAITSILLPATCRAAYDGQIPSCTVDDFNLGCSALCQTALLSLSEEVTTACATVIASPNTLLGIVKNGNIIPALCPRDTRTTTTARQTPTSTPFLSSATIPTPNSSVAGGKSSTYSTGFRSSTSLRQTATAASTTSTASVEVPTPPPSTAQPPSTVLPPVAEIPTEQTSATSSSGRASPTRGTDSPLPEGASVDTGGGSPFDVTSSGIAVERNSALAGFVAIAWTLVLVGR